MSNDVDYQIPKRRRILSLPSLPILRPLAKSNSAVQVELSSSPTELTLEPVSLETKSTTTELPGDKGKEKEKSFWFKKSLTSNVNLISDPPTIPPTVTRASAPARKLRAHQHRAPSTLTSARVIYNFINGSSSSSAKGNAENLKKVKKDLAKPDKARKIIEELKNLQQPPLESEEVKEERAPIKVKKVHEVDVISTPAKKISLVCGEEDLMKKQAETLSKSYVVAASTPTEGASAHQHTHANDSTEEDPAVPQPQLSIQAMMTLPVAIPSAGTVVGSAADASGAYTMLADVSATLVQASGRELGDIPVDRMTVGIYWWGYEVFLPPPTIAYLSGVHSVSGTFFTFLSTLASTGGAPELAPFIRYVSMWVDMEWKAITSQNTGKGVILAATWVLPVAIVPRPWDV